MSGSRQESSAGDTATQTAAFVYEDRLAAHELSAVHPMKPIRIRHAFELARAAGFLDGPRGQVLEPRPATMDELLLFHERVYLDAVKTIGAGLSIADELMFGFNGGDNPAYPGLFEAQALSAGSTLVAAESVLSGFTNVAFAPAGGLHHAMPRRASGFCVFNDPAIAIQKLVDEGLRIAYVDIDCHHGDGVQHAFYRTDRVLTISIHESGQFLFPGTGFITEIGTGKGAGYSVNLPLAPYTGDAVYLEVFDAIVPPLLRAFEPDAVFTQLGIDTHYLDPITHLRLTTQGFTRVVAKLADVIRETCNRWIASGGGGYDLGAVARGWAMAYAVMAGVDIPDCIPDSFTALPNLTRFADVNPDPLNARLDPQVRAYAQRSVEELRKSIFPRFGLA